jgi:hypothetical protein
LNGAKEGFGGAQLSREQGFSDLRSEKSLCFLLEHAKKDAKKLDVTTLARRE